MSDDRYHWTAFGGVYGVKYKDAMKVAADARRELARRMAAVDEFLAIREEEYNRVTEDRQEQPAIESLREIRGWFSGELELACRALGLDAECVGERAAICEIDHGYPRRQACIMALRQYLQYCGRYDDRVKAIVDSGGILDMARRALDEVKIYRTIGHDMSLLHYVKPE